MATIQLNRGIAAGLPSLLVGEPAFTTDTHELYVGSGSGNILIGPGSVSDGDKGDVTVSAGGAVWTIDSGAVTFAKMQSVSANVLLGNDGAGTTVEEIPCTAAGRALIDDADAAAQRVTLGLGTIAMQDASSVAITGGSISGITDLAVADGGTGASTAAGARANLGLVIGTNVQAWDADLDALAGVTSAADKLPYFTGAATATVTTLSAFGRSLIDDADAAAARATLGLGALAVLGTVGTSQIDNDAVTYAKLQNISATSRVLGRKTAGSGDAEECTLSEVLDFVGSAAQGDLLYRGAGSWSRLGAGTAGQVLQSNGAGADPSWASTSATRMTGEIIPYAGPVIPSGWLLCDGSTYSVATYPALAALLFPSTTATVTIASPGVVTWTAHGLLAGTPVSFTSSTGSLPTGLTVGVTYFVKTVLSANTFTLSATANGAAINTSGSQSGTHTMYCVAWNTSGFTPGSTFQVPLLSGKVPVGYAWNVGGTSDFYLGKNGGAETHTLATSEIPAHSHAGSAGNFVTSNAGGGAALAGGTGYQQTATTANAGGGGSHNNLQPYTAVMYIIKT